MWTLFIVTLSTAIACCTAEIGSYDYDNKIEENAVNDRDNLTSNVYVLPEQIFNDGKPFYVKKDASGTIDFNAKTTPESLPTPTDAISTLSTVNSSTGSVNSTRKHDISLDNTVRAQNIHDFLNLPVKYQSSKFVYPLVSSSYANLKYQGNNKNYISNHKHDSSTAKSVAYTTKKYHKSTYSTKAYAMKSSTTESYESTTKATPAPTNNSTRKYANIPSRSSTPGRRYTTLSRVSSTTVRNSLPNTEVKHTRGRPTTTTTTTTTTQKAIESHDNTLAAPSQSSTTTTAVPDTKAKNATESTKEPDGMNFGDLFGYFFNNDNSEDSEDSEETDATRPTTPTKATPSTTERTLRPAISTTHAPAITKQNDNKKAYSSRYDITMDSATRKPINRTHLSELNTSTARPLSENENR